MVLGLSPLAQTLFDSLGERMYNLSKKVNLVPLRAGLGGCDFITNGAIGHNCGTDGLFGQNRQARQLVAEHLLNRIRSRKSRKKRKVVRSHSNSRDPT